MHSRLQRHRAILPCDRAMVRALCARGDALALAALAGAWTAVIAVVGVGGDFPLNDDWAYAWSARHLLHTGHMRILDWAAPSLVAHVAWGAALLRLFGDSLVVLRVGTLGWAALGIALVYALARQAGHPPRIAVVPALATALSPWYLNLSFTYMTDVPWIALVLASMWTFERALRRADGSGAWLLATSGTLIGTASLIRNFAVIVTPAFVATLAIDGGAWDRRAAPRWLRTALGGALVAAPVALLYGAFSYWYARVHGPTLANRDTWTRMAHVGVGSAFRHALVFWHYAGLWAVPLLAGLIARRRMPRIITPLRAGAAVVLLSGYAVWAALHVPPGGPSAVDFPTMPYLGNIFYRVGLGPPTLHDTYEGFVPPVHRASWFGVALTTASVLGGVLAGAATAESIRRGAHTVRQRWRRVSPSTGALAAAALPERPWRGRRRLRTLAIGVALTYVAWHLATDDYAFDRYLIPLIPLTMLVWIDALPSRMVASPGTLALIVVGGLWSVAGTREYMSWNVARWAATQDLQRQGVPDTEVDAGFEINGLRHFEAYFLRTHQLIPLGGAFWITHARYQLSFWPTAAGCRTWARYPYWTWAPRTDAAIYVLRCGR